jgi:hypothetical protein
MGNLDEPEERSDSVDRIKVKTRLTGLYKTQMRLQKSGNKAQKYASEA